MAHISTATVRRLGVGFFAVIILFSLPLFAEAQVATNLIQNPSLETAAAGVPSTWIKDYWGSPTPTFTYPVAGHAGNGASITLSANSTGDGHWQPTAVAVTAGQTYTYSMWYSSTAAAEIDAEYTSSTGATSYAWLADVASSAGVWKQISVTVTIPTGMTKASIYMLLDKKGTLTIDDISLTQNGAVTPPPAPTAPTLSLTSPLTTIALGAGATLNWSSTNATSCTASGGWTGTKAISGSQVLTPTVTTTYILSCTGSGGTVSQQITVTVTGSTPPPPPPAAPTLTFSASPTAITAGQPSTLSWSTTNATSCTASNGWSGTQAVSGTLAVSPTANATYVLACTGAGGNVSKQVAITVTAVPPPPTGNAFSEGMVTLSFDDAWASQYSSGLSILQSSGLPATFYLISEVIQNNSNFPGYMTPTMATTIANAGYEIADHTITHPDLTTLSSSQVTNEITASRTYLQTLTGKSITSLAYPYGAVNTTVKNLTSQAGYTSARGVDDSQLNTPKSDKLNLFGQCIENTDTLASIESWIDKAKANKQWYILCFHEIKSDGAQYSTSPTELQQIINYIKQVGIKTVTVSQGRALMQ